MFRKRMIMGFLLCFCFIFPGTAVYAGNINAEEQRVINYYSKTFYYKGKAYVASESAKSSAYAKLVQDGVDLNAAQADNMILQLSGNVGNGVEQGYLVEVASKPDSAEENTEGTGTGSTGTDTEGTGSTDKDTGNNQTDNENNTDNQVPNQIENSDGNGASSPADGENQREDTQDKDKKKVETGKIIRDAIEREQDGQELAIYTNSGKKIRADQIAKSLEKGPVTVKDYTEGIMRTFSADGTLLYEASLPIRNTGYGNGRWFLAPFIILAGLLILVVLCFVRPKWKIPWQGYSAIFTVLAVAAVAAGGRDMVQSYLAKWRAVWVSGAPEYAYKEDAAQRVSAEDGKEYAAVLHSQYGKLSCVNVELETPLYYGDSDTDLDKGAGIYAGSVLPGDAGTTLIGGHDTTYFAQLQHMDVDDVIRIDAVDGTYYYRVTETKIAEAGEEDAYQLQDAEDELILYTCYPFGKISKERSQRFFVYAMAMDSEESVQ